MTYSTGNLILAQDFNNFTANVNAVWNASYGQTAGANVSVGNIVTAAQWATLNTNISNIAAHQGTAITTRANPVAGGIITALANVATDINSCSTNKYNAATQGSQYTAWTGSASATSGAGSGSNPWTLTFTDTITFANATAASNFFNAGGTVKIQVSKTSTGTVADTEWNNFINTVCGTIYLTSTGASKVINGQTYTGTTKIGGTGTPTILATGTGFAQLSSTPAILYKQFDSGSAYSSNYVQISASVSGATLTLTIVWYDAGDSNPGSTAQISGGSATTGISFGSAPATVVTYFPPETTYLTNAWGAPTVASSVA
jgi:hypothetical protein